MAAVTEVLADYARGDASESDVVRALLAHDGWYAPMIWLDEAFPERRVYDSMIPTPALGQAPAPGRLWLFTDAGRVQAAIDGGAAFAAAGGPVRGVDVFGALSRTVSEVRVNPAGPAVQGWSMGIDDAVLDFFAPLDQRPGSRDLADRQQPRTSAPAWPPSSTTSSRSTTPAGPASWPCRSRRATTSWRSPRRTSTPRTRSGTPASPAAADMAAATLFQLADYDGVDGVVLDMKESDSFVLPQDLCDAVLKLIA